MHIIGLQTVFLKNARKRDSGLAFLYRYYAYLYIMNGRENRLKAIRTIIAASRTSSQDKLLHKLEEEGVKVTQAT
ncbi:MAG: hypothetical protein DRP70_13055, partial [Spirochaetes bacterium]